MKSLMTSLLTLMFLQAFAAEYTLEPTHTYAYFKINHLNRGMMTGVFTEVEGTVLLDGEHEANPSMDITVKVASLDTWDEKRDQHLLGPDFFNAKRYKTMTFKSTKIEKLDGNHYAITGKLTIRGKSKTITATAIRGDSGLDPWGGYRIGGNITVEIDRRDFGMNAVPEPAVGNVVQLDLYWEALRK